MSPSRSKQGARFGWIAFLATCLTTAISGICPAVDQEVGAGKPFATIGAAIAASTAGTDRVVVFDGTYNEQVVWDRAVDIVAGPDQNPVLLYNGGANDVIVVAYSGSARWDGIDVTLDKTILGGTIFFILRDLNTQVTLENFTFSDTENASGNPKTFFCHGGCLVNINNFTYAAQNALAEGVFFVQVGSKLVANGCTLNGISDKHIWINQAGTDPTKITVNDSLFTKPDAGGHLIMVFHGEVEVNDSDLVLDGGASRGIITLNSGQAQKITVNRSVLDGTRVAGGRLVNIENALTDITFRNSAMLLRADSFGIYGGLGGTVTMVHSTMSAPSHAGNRGIVGPENAGASLSVTLDNNIFSLPGSTRGVVHDPALGGTLTVSSGTNLRWLDGGSGSATDALNGTIIDADPLLAADRIHVPASSPAVDAGEDAGVGDDIDRCLRFTGAAPDLGADEQGGALEVGPGKTYATIGAAMAAVGSCDQTILVYDGTYNEQVVWDKPVDIVAAPGQNPVLQYNGGANDVIVVAYSGSARWDGIDVTLDKTILGGTIFFILKDSNTRVTLENFTFSDTENASGNPKTFFCHGGCLVNINNFTYSAQNSLAEAVFFVQVGSKLVANGCTLNGISDKHTWINQAGPDATKITINDSVLTKPDAGGHLVMVFHGEVEVNDSDLVLDGGASRGIITLNSGQAQKISVNRSVLDGTRIAGGRLVNIENALTDITFTNSALVLRADSFGIFGGLGGTVTMVHSTMSAPHHVGNRGIVGPESPGVTLDVTLDNNVFSLPGSNRGVVHDPALGGTLTVTSGTNLRWLADGTGGPTDALNGTIIDADPKLEADGIHVLASSPAINAAEDLGILDDIDGEPRPGVTVPESSLPDLGADEFSGDLPMSPPSGLGTSPGEGALVLFWSPPSGSGPPVQGYNVYQTSPGDRTKLNEGLVTETGFTATGLENGVEACFVVRSVGPGDLESEDSNEACGTPVLTGGEQIPGDCTQDGTLDISDAVCLLGHLFLGSPEVLPCDGGTILDPGNIGLLDSNGDAGINIADPVHLLGYLFLGSGPPVSGTECTAIVGCPGTNCNAP